MQKIITGLSEDYIHTIKHEIKTETNFNNLVLFSIFSLSIKSLSYYKIH